MSIFFIIKLNLRRKNALVISSRSQNSYQRNGFALILAGHIAQVNKVPVIELESRRRNKVVSRIACHDESLVNCLLNAIVRLNVSTS